STSASSGRVSADRLSPSVKSGSLRVVEREPNFTFGGMGGGGAAGQAGVTQVVISACTTSTPALSVMLTGTTTSAPSVMAAKSGGSSRAVARSDVVALAR